MKSYHYEAVVYEGEIFCVECLPDGISEHSDDVMPIFANSEWDYTPICCKCGCEHDYVSIIPHDVNWQHDGDLFDI